MSKKIFIIGGGAAGIMCALKLAEKGGSVTLAEKNPRVGKKLLASGNGKCNLSNLDMSVAAYNSDFVQAVIDKFPPKKIIDEFAALGLMCRADDEGRVYPYSESATSLLNVLLQKLYERGVAVVCDCLVQKVDKISDVFKITTSKGVYTADAVVLATGSDATSGCNSHSLIKQFSHAVTPLSYAIAPLISNDVKGANGVRAKVNARMVIDGQDVMSERGELLFKDGALSGILAFRLSSMLARRRTFKCCQVHIDFVPDMEQSELYEFILKNCSAAAPLDGVLHKALAYNVISKIPMDRSLLMSPKKARDIAAVCKDFVVNIDGVAGKNNAQVASGGIALDGIDPQTMQSKLCGGLYIIGEVSDVDGLCGGYNLHWAWASALACSENILK